MTFESGIALALATLVFACIPGPGISAVVAQSLARGFKAGAGFTLGLALGDVCYLLTALFGMGWVASQIGPYFVVLKWAGAAYLVYMGVKCWTARPNFDPQPECAASARTGRSFLAGLCVTLGNPKAIAFYCGFLPGFVDMASLTGTDVALVMGIIVPIIGTVPPGLRLAGLAGPQRPPLDPAVEDHEPLRRNHHDRRGRGHRFGVM